MMKIIWIVTIVSCVSLGTIGIHEQLAYMDELNDSFIKDHSNDNCNELVSDFHQFDKFWIKPVKYDDWVNQRMMELKCK